MSKWTLGEWHHGTANGYGGNGVYADTEQGETGIASVYGISLHARVEEVEAIARCAEGVANARLIASAPALHASLTELVARYGQGADATTDMMQRAREALRKSEGDNG